MKPKEANPQVQKVKEKSLLLQNINQLENAEWEDEVMCGPSVTSDGRYLYLNPGEGPAPLEDIVSEDTNGTLEVKANATSAIVHSNSQQLLRDDVDDCESESEA